MLSEKETTRISKFLSLILRHKPESVGITLDEQGWVSVKILIEKVNETGIKLNEEMLHHVVETNNKKRFAFNEAGDKIRASQGHSVEVELGYEPKVPPEILYHGTAEKSEASILLSGLEKRNRHQVHLSKHIDTAINVGQRHGKPVVFEILSGKMHEDGYSFFISENGVWLTEHVPPVYIRKFIHK